FVVGGAAWTMRRSGKADPANFGILEMIGSDYVKGDILCDVASMNKMEVLPWECWGLILADYADIPPHEMAMLEQLADLTDTDVPDFDPLRQIYESNPRLWVGHSIESFVNGTPITVAI